MLIVNLGTRLLSPLSGLSAPNTTIQYSYSAAGYKDYFLYRLDYLHLTPLYQYSYSAAGYQDYFLYILDYLHLTPPYQHSYSAAGYQDPYSPTILKFILSLVVQIFLHLEAFECNIASDWLNHTG